MTAEDIKALGKVAVLMGGRSQERKISLMSGQGVLGALRAQGVNAHPFDPGERPMQALLDEGYARCFIALHGRYGEDGTVQGALELLGIPYTGSGVMASSIGIDKVMTKRVWSDEGLPVPQQVLLRAGQVDDVRLAQAVEALGLPVIVKPSREGSSLGVTKVTDAAQMRAAVDAAAALDVDVMCEQCISGEELTCPVLGTGDAAQALPVIRIAAPDGNYDFEHKYFSDDTKYLIPSGLPAAEEQAVQELALKAYRALGCRGWGRVDLMLDAATRQPYLLEINTSPGMTGHSLVPMAARAVGIDYEQLCLRLLAGATLDYAREGISA